MPIRYDGIPMAQVTIHVPPRPYQARIENGLLARSGTLLAELLPHAGKGGVNLGAGKNLLGTFYHPRAVLIDPEVLRTLPNRDFRAGLYEALKCGIIGDVDLFLRFEQKRAQILNRDPVEIEGVIAQSVKLKAEVVSADEHEGGLRRVLHLGHTIRHALEAETGYRTLLHGEAVAWGMIAATDSAPTVGRTYTVPPVPSPAPCPSPRPLPLP